VTLGCGLAQHSARLSDSIHSPLSPPIRRPATSTTPEYPRKYMFGAAHLLAHISKN
jgi:hypothetical protein